jgi:RimJ/RimL family protein N-acetyltransferase
MTNQGNQGTWVAAADPAEFTRTTIPLLATQATRNTLILTVFDRLRTEGPHAFGERDPQMLTWYDAQGAPVGALLRTPPYSYLLSDVPAESIEPLIDLMLDPASGHDGREMNLPEPIEAAFTAAWTARTGDGPRVVERIRLYRLEELIAPNPAPEGVARLATNADVEFVARCLEAFWEEAGQPMPKDPRMTALRMAHARIAEEIFWLWLDASGAPVSFAGHTPVVAGMGRVGPVYTPPEQRGRGYAAGVTTAVTRALLDRGADEVLLFTDLANPVSNRLYQRLGYRPVSDRSRLEFS